MVRCFKSNVLTSPYHMQEDSQMCQQVLAPTEKECLWQKSKIFLLLPTEA